MSPTCHAAGRSVEPMLARIATSPSMGSIRARSWWRSTSASGLPTSRSSGWEMRRSASRATGSARPSSTPASSSRPARSRPTWRRHSCARPAPALMRRWRSGVLVASEQVPARRLAAYAVFGELSLGGELRDSPGRACRGRGRPAGGSAPADRAARAGARGGDRRRRRGGGRSSLREAAELLRGADPPPLPASARSPRAGPRSPTWRTCAVRPRRCSRSRSPPPALTTCSWREPPGTGKTMLARRLPSILPEMSRTEAIEVTRLHSVAGLHTGGLDLGSAVPRPAPHDLAVRAGRRGRAAATRGGHARPSWRALSRRALGVSAPRPRCAPPAARGRLRDDRARAARARVPDAVHAGRRDQSVPVRVRRRGRPLPVPRRPAPPPPASEWPAARSDGPAGECRAPERGELRAGPAVDSARARERVAEARERQRSGSAGTGARQRRDGRARGPPLRRARADGGRRAGPGLRGRRPQRPRAPPGHASGPDDRRPRAPRPGRPTPICSRAQPAPARRPTRRRWRA